MTLPIMNSRQKEVIKEALHHFTNQDCSGNELQFSRETVGCLDNKEKVAIEHKLAIRKLILNNNNNVLT